MGEPPENDAIPSLTNRGNKALGAGTRTVDVRARGPERRQTLRIQVEEERAATEPGRVERPTGARDGPSPSFLAKPGLSGLRLVPFRDVGSRR